MNLALAYAAVLLAAITPGTIAAAIAIAKTHTEQKADQ